MVNLTNFIEHMGAVATLKHITGKDYDDDYDEATPVYSSSSVYALMQPLTGEDLKQLTGGVVDKATLKAYLSPDISISEEDRLTVGRETWRVEQVFARKDEYIKVLLSQLTLPQDAHYIAIISDAHWGQSDGDRTADYGANTASFISEAGTSYDTVIAVGDMFEGRSDQSWAANTANFIAGMKALDITDRIFVRGNHDADDTTRDDVDALLEAGGWVVEDAKRLTYTTTGGTTNIVCIDVCLTEWDEYAIQNEHLNELITALASGNRTYLFCHVPAVCSAFTLTNPKQLTYLFGIYDNFKGIISGHNHNAVGYQDIDTDITRGRGCGYGGCKRRLRGRAYLRWNSNYRHDLLC